MHVKILKKNFEVIKLIIFEVDIVTIAMPKFYNNIMRDFVN